MRITSREELDALYGSVIWYSVDGGRTYQYGRLLKPIDPAWDPSVNNEVLKNTVHSSTRLLPRSISAGKVLVRLATETEAQGKQFSYENR